MLRRRKKGRGGLLPVSAAGGFAGYLLAMLLLYGLAALISAELVEEPSAEGLTLGAAFAGSAAAAVIAAKRRGRGVMTAGLLAGSLCCLMLMVTSLGAGGEGGIMCLKLVISSLAGGAFGGTACLNTKKNKKLRGHLYKT